jgi:hypothetical protein
MGATACLAAALAATIWLSTPSRAEAIPEWARKYKTSCVTCHEAFPSLNPVGEAFRLNGYRFPDDLYVKEEPVILGQDAYKKVWPDAIWPSDIPAYAPLAIRVRGAAGEAPYGMRTVRNSLNFFDELNILAAGTLGESNSFFLELSVEGAEVSFSPRLNFEALFQGDIEDGKWLNLSIGYVGDHEIDLPELQDAQRVGFVNYLKSSWKNPVPGTITDGAATQWSNASSDFVLGPQAGIMLYGFHDYFKYAVGLTNGEGGIPDRNSRKDGFIQASYKFGGRSFSGKGGPTGQGKNKEELSSSPAGGWVDDSVTLGFFGYIGAGRIDATPVAPAGPTVSTDDLFWRWGMDVRWKIGSFTFAGGFLLGRDNNPYGAAAPGAVSSTEFLFEAKWFAYPWLIPLVRLEYLNLKVPAGVVGSDFDGTALGLVDGDGTGGYALGSSNTIERLVFEAHILYRANIKITPFAVVYLRNTLRTQAGLPAKDDTLLGLAVDFAF